MDQEKHVPEKEAGEEIHSHQEGKLTKKMRENPWIFSTFVLGVLGLILLIGNFGGITGGTITGGVVDEGEINNLALDFFNNKLSNGQGGVIESVSEKSGIYEIVFSARGQELPLYFTKDGKWIQQGSELISIIGEAIQQSSQQPTTTEYSEDELQELSAFNDCLADNGMVIYGSDTCPACRALVSLLGGYDVASSVFVECGKNRERCNEETQTGYVPEIQLNGELYEGGRTLEALGELTGCTTPQLS